MSDFSQFAERYVASRPVYPADLYRYLASLTANRAVAWDCATGNGQAAVALAEHYRQVVATDISAQQIELARSHPRVAYWVASAESSGLTSSSVDLVTVAAAVHWFRFEEFYREVERVLRPGGILAVWGYHLCHVGRGIDERLRAFYEMVEPYFAPAFHHLTSRYRTLPFPANEVSPVPAFEMSAHWEMDALLGFVGSWSGVRRFASERGYDPVPGLAAEIAPFWGEADTKRLVRWHLYLRIARF